MFTVNSARIRAILRMRRSPAGSVICMAGGVDWMVDLRHWPRLVAFRPVWRSIPVAVPLALLVAAPVRAGLIITPSFDVSITSDPNAAAIEATINAAIGVYEKDFGDPITVNILFQEIHGGLGFSSAAFEAISYSQFLAALTADATTANDAIALDHLGAGTNDPVLGSPYINLKLANLRAIGIDASPPPGQPDGTIGLNTSITGPGSPGTTGAYDLLAVTEHEIDEILGLRSSLPFAPDGNIFPEDLFRYDSSGQRSFTTNSFAHAYFSIDGSTLLAQFDNQYDGGDFGDWQSNPLPIGTQPQVQDAFATPGAHPTLGISELAALDVIGYDLETPEPATGTLLAMALLAGCLMRRRADKNTRQA